MQKTDRRCRHVRKTPFTLETTAVKPRAPAAVASRGGRAHAIPSAHENAHSATACSESYCCATDNRNTTNFHVHFLTQVPNHSVLVVWGAVILAERVEDASRTYQTLGKVPKNVNADSVSALEQGYSCIHACCGTGGRLDNEVLRTRNR